MAVKLGIDLSTRAGALRFAELRRREITQQYLAWGKLERNPVVFIFAAYGAVVDTSARPPVRRGAKLPGIQAVPVPIDVAEKVVGWRKATRVAGQAVRMVVEATQAVGTLLVMDAWAADESKAPEDHHYGWVEENQDGEGLLMRLEHLALPHAMSWASIIHRDPLRLDPWVGGEQQQGDDKGRLESLPRLEVVRDG